jgi:hypothetical protein
LMAAPVASGCALSLEVSRYRAHAPRALAIRVGLCIRSRSFI